MTDTPEVYADEIFRRLEALPPEERAAFIDEHCTSEAVRNEVLDRLGTLDVELADFLASPPINRDELEKAERRTIGPYRLLQQIGEGGFGIVYMAEQERPVRRNVALKVLKPGMDSREVLARFEAERQALAMMSHPNIATVLDVGATGDGHPYFVMELVKGIPITDFCDKGNLSTRERLEIAREVCRAVEHAHQKGIIHRDLKPSNILVTLHGETPVPKVIDFGVAKALNQPLTEKTLFTRYGQMVGTPAYMSPEQADLSGLDVDTRSDVYSLGVLLYELLTGTTPLDAERLRSAGFAEIQRIICEEEPPTPSTRVSLLGRGLASIANRRRTESSKLRQLLRGELDWVVMRALEKDRARRYQSANALSADIDRYLRNEPVEACPPTMRYRLAKSASKHRALLSAVATILVILAATTTVSVWQAFVASGERDRALDLAGRLDDSLAEAKTLAAQAAASAREASEKEQIARDSADEANRLRLAAEDAEERLREQLYVSHMNRIGTEYAAGNLNEVTRLLDAHRPQPEQSDLRGFEWYYWWRAVHRDLRTLYRVFVTQGPNYSIAVSPTNRWIAVPYYFGQVEIWDVARMRRVRTLEPGDDPRYASFSPDGKLLAVGAGERIVLFDVQGDWASIRTLWLTGGWQEARLVFSPGGRTLASATPEGGEITLWDTETWSPTVHTVEELALGSNLAFSPDDTLLAVGSSRDEFRVILWDVAARKTRTSALGHRRRVTSVAWSTDGRLLASGSADGTLRLWDADLEAVATLEAGATVTAIEFSPGDTYLAAAVRETNSVVVWRTDSKDPVVTIRGHAQAVTDLAFVGNATTLWTVGREGYTRIWDLGRAGPIETIPLGPSQRDLVLPIRSDLAEWRSSSFLGVVSISGQRAVLAHEPGKRIERWNLEGELLRVPWDEDKTYAAAGLSNDGRFLVTGTSDGRLRTWDCTDGKRLVANTLESSTLKNPFKTMISNDGQIVAVANRAGGEVEILFLDRKRGTRRRLPLGGEEIHGAVLSPGGKYLAVRATFDVDVWDLQAVEPTVTHRLRHTPPRSVAFSGDGGRIVLGCWDNNIYVHDIETGEQTQELKGHVGQVTSVGFSPDDRFLLSGSVDETVRLWDLQSGKLLSTLIDHDGMVDYVHWARDALSLLSISTEGGSIKVWRRATEAEVARDIVRLADLACSYFDQDDWPAALAVLDEAVDIAPDDPEPRLWRAITQADLLGLGIDALMDFGAAAESIIFDEQLLARVLRWIDLRPLAASSRVRILPWRFTTEQPAGGEEWRTLEFDDASWKVGEGPFGSFGARTEWRGSDIWLRHEFELDRAVETPLVFLANVDDEAEFFLNGEPAGKAEIFLRDYYSFQRIESTAEPRVLKPGRNVLAVHVVSPAGKSRIAVGLYATAASRESEDFFARLVAAFGENPRGLELRSRFYAARGDWASALADQKRIRAIRQREEGDSTGPVRELVPGGSAWRYMDEGRDAGTSWRDPDHDDSRWSEGRGPLGYGDPVATVVGVLADADGQPGTRYFRHTFNVDDRDRFSALTLHLRRDDGAAVYLNGVEVVRDGLPEEADHDTLSERTVEDEDELRYVRFDVAPEHLRSGGNVIAVEVHQAASTTSPDLSFDLVLEGRVPAE